MSERTTVAWKVLTGGQMAEFLAAGHFAGASVDLADGYIHMSTLVQLAGTVEKHFAGQDGLFLAKVDLDALGDAVRWEAARGGVLFPHLYNRLPLSAVISHEPLRRNRAGTLVLPVQD